MIPVKFWKDLYAHPNYDAWWKARDARNATKNLKPAMLWVGGLFDAEDNWGAWNSYKAAETNNKGKEFNKLVMGPWYHAQWANSDRTHLRGMLNFGSNTSPVSINQNKFLSLTTSPKTTVMFRKLPKPIFLLPALMSGGNSISGHLPVKKIKFFI